MLTLFDWIIVMLSITSLLIAALVYIIPLYLGLKAVCKFFIAMWSSDHSASFPDRHP